uniref:X-box-binding protein 1 n=1 Tax=Graphocephala atropunctata TaxID=36148 RepID=A0A1B6M315_9HEMI
MLSSRNATKTIVLKSPDSDKIREVIVTSVLLPKSENENIRTAAKYLRNSEEFEQDLGFMMEKRVCKRRLDHLSIEEKILRKKLKNREAAQTSRDRKKARLEELEASVVELQNENDSLHEEVRSLRDDKESLQRENARLTEEVWRLSVVGGGDDGPAASRPLPQGASPPPALPPTFPSGPRSLLLFSLLSLTLSRLMTGTGLIRCPSLRSSRSLSNSQILSLLKLVVLLKKQNHRKKIWWGRRQKAWNPVGPV